MSLVLDTVDVDGSDLSQALGTKNCRVMGFWTNSTSRDILVRLQVFLGDLGGRLDSNAATFTAMVDVKEGGVYTSFSTETFVKETAADTSVFLNLGPYLVADGEEICVYVHSTNANDTDIDALTYIIDTQAGIDVRAIGGTAVGLNASNNLKVSVDDWGDTDVSAKLQGGYPQVDMVSVGGNTPMSTADVNTECDTALTDYDPPTRTEATADKDAIITEVNANETKIDAIPTASGQPSLGD